MFKKLSVIVLSILLTMCFAVPVSASVAVPDTFTLSSAEVYRDCLETNDQLYIITGTVEYASNPTGYNVSDLVLVRIMNGATELKSSVPYAYYDSGFDYFVLGIYFSANDVSTLGMGWGAGTGYSVQMMGNPTIDWASIPTVTMSTLQLWYDGTSFEDTQTRLAARIRVLARTAENNYDPTSFVFTESIAGVLKFTTYGEDYFTNTIPNLPLMCPDLFKASQTPVNLTEKILTNDYYAIGGTGTAQTYGANWRAQTYTAKGTYEVVGAYLQLYVVGNPGTITVALKATAAGLPNGANLASGTIASTLVTTNTAGDWYQIVFTSEYTQTLGVTYAVVVSATTGDANNYVMWAVDTTGTMSGGSRCDSTDSGASWVADTGDDFMFIVKGGIGTQTGSYAKQLQGRLYGTDLGDAVDKLATVMGVPFDVASSLIWVVVEFAVAALISIAARSYKFYLLAMALLAPIGAYTGFWDLNIAVAIGVILGLAGLYVAFHK